MLRVGGILTVGTHEVEDTGGDTEGGHDAGKGLCALTGGGDGLAGTVGAERDKVRCDVQSRTCQYRGSDVWAYERCREGHAWIDDAARTPAVEWMTAKLGIKRCVAHCWVQAGVQALSPLMRHD